MSEDKAARVRLLVRNYNLNNDCEWDIKAIKLGYETFPDRDGTYLVIEIFTPNPATVIGVKGATAHALSAFVANRIGELVYTRGCTTTRSNVRSHADIIRAANCGSTQPSKRRIMNSPYCIVRFGKETGTWHQTTIDAESVVQAVQIAQRPVGIRMAHFWPWVYVALDGYIVENVSGPDLRGMSCALAHDYFQSFQPVHLDETLGDSI